VPRTASESELITALKAVKADLNSPDFMHKAENEIISQE